MPAEVPFVQWAPGQLTLDSKGTLEKNGGFVDFKLAFEQGTSLHFIKGHQMPFAVSPASPVHGREAAGLQRFE